MLSTRTITPKLQSELQAWRQNLVTKKSWLQARLEHVEAVDRLLEEVLKNANGPPSR